MHTPVWPKYIPVGRDRTLIAQRGDGRWVDEAGEIHTAETLAEVCDLLFQTNGQAFCGAIELLPWFGEIPAYVAPLDSDTGRVKPPTGDTIHAAISVHPASLTPIQISFTRRWPNKNGKMQAQTRKITGTSVWGVPCVPQEILPRLRWLFDTLESGVQSTPGSTGSLVMQREWGKNPGPREHRPPLQLVKLLQDHAVGSRKESYSPDEVFDMAYEADMTNGFAAQADILPSGTVAWYGQNGHAHHYLLPLVGDPEAQREASIRQWWGRCYVRLWRDLAPGDVAPFATRDADTGELSWPTRAGGYWCYLWGFEADEIAQRGQAESGLMEVLGIEWAWVWSCETTQLAGWAEHMDRIRTAAQYGDLAGTEDPAEKKVRAGLVKLCIVAGIGRLGVPYERLTVIPEEQAQPGDVELQSEQVSYLGLYARREFCDMGTPAHWHKFILSRMNFAIYERLRYNYLHGIRSIGANVDGVVSVECPPDYTPVKAVGMGAYKFSTYDLYTMPAAGSVLAHAPDGSIKVALPGVPEAVRGTIASGQLRRLGEARHTQTRGEILSEQGKRIFLRRMHEAAQEAIDRREADMRKLAELENHWTWVQQRRYWDRIAGRDI